ncbi:MAG: lysophospholipid acyltransferase family protein [Atopobiaceae bacterium]|nr:1-acyl-sn-glycerol-3-phosphate acyltransferase [Atopobiaceae bacterium]MCH4214274.1 1-acyl-sn-glycerol-3-phosphate acyltransferase [Atopobiaceae bacterium]MCH4276099.1 1-acyl-sn-glycerol-3-phosphate acyltransferase [Atopobiaceae bacterium]MCI1259661.1 1-acyl-sn-glycerol-3-phosphate acyltransferase [Atopobiaceae bacterium]MDD3177362.1 lysophospholipid acyltransferase family protein [Atopobiaceae bacterium]
MRIRLPQGGMPDVSGAVVVCNHVAVLDCAMLSCACAPAQLTFLSEAGNARGLIGLLTRALGCVFVDTEHGLAGSRRMFDRLRETILAGGTVAVYPEGVREQWRCGLATFREGAFRLAQMCNAAVLPVVIAQTPVHHGLCRIMGGRPGLEVRVGELVHAGAGRTGEVIADLQHEVTEQMESLLA